jgi:hypothetical protein
MLRTAARSDNLRLTDFNRPKRKTSGHRLKRDAMKTLIRTLTAALLLSTSAHAYKGEVTFSPEEIQRHQEGIQTVMDTAAACLKADIDYHQSFHKKWKISPFYGDRGTFARVKQADGSYRGTTAEEKRRYLRSYKRYTEEQIDYYLKIVQPTSCVGLVIKCLGQGFKAAGQEDIWAKLRAFTMANDVEGGALQEGLQNLGWTLMFWNPNTSLNAWFDQDEQRRNPDNKDYIWGKHVYNWNAVQTSRKYLYNRVDDITSLVNFGEQVPHVLRNIPFFVGVAHMGYHVFPGTFGRVIEGHSTRNLSDYQTIESSPFNPLVDGGGPRGFYRSGLIAVPPGYQDMRLPEGMTVDLSPNTAPGSNPEPSRRPERRRSPSLFDIFNW